MTRRKNYNPLLKSYPDSVLVNSVSEGAEVLYVRLIAQSDDAGRYWGCPKLVAAKLFSHRFANEEVSVKEIGSRISELMGVGLIHTYEVSGQPYLVMVDVYKQLRKDVKPVITFPGPENGGSAPASRTVPHPLRNRPSISVPTQPNPPQPTPTQPSKKRSSLDVNKLLLEEFPDLSQASGFVQAWSDWTRYRKELGKKLTASTARSQLKRARSWGPVSFIAEVRRSIEHGWTGLFLQKQGALGSSGPAPRAAGAIEDFLRDGNGEENSPRVVDID